MQRRNSDFLKSKRTEDDKSSDSITTAHSRLLRRDRQHHLEMIRRAELPISKIQVDLLLKKVQSKYRDAKVSPGGSFYCRISKDDKEFHLVVTKRAFPQNPKEEGEAKSLTHFLHQNSVFLLDFDKKLGEGAQGKVVLAYDLESSKPVAVKICNTFNNSFEKKANTA